jgi:outer membrane protein
MRSSPSSSRVAARQILLASTLLLLATPRLSAQEAIPLSLDEALRLAALESDEVAIAAAAERRADADGRRARAERRPQLGLWTTYQRTLASQFDDLFRENGTGQPPPPVCVGPFTPDSAKPIEDRVEAVEERLACPPAGPFNGLDLSRAGFGADHMYNIGLSASWTAYDGGRVASRRRAAEAGRTSAQIGVASTRAQLQLEVTEAYFDAQLADRMLEIVEATLAQAEETLRLTQLRAQEGEQAEFEVLRARVARDNQRPTVIQRQTQRDLAYDRLRMLLNLPADRSLVLTTRLESVVPVAAGAEGAPDPRAMQLSMFRHREWLPKRQEDDCSQEQCRVDDLCSSRMTRSPDALKKVGQDTQHTIRNCR